MKRKRRSVVKETTIDDMDDESLDDLNYSTDEYTKEEDRAIENVRRKRVSEIVDSEDEVYGFQNEHSETEDAIEEEEEDENNESSMGSDIEGLEKDDYLPDERAWGQKKRSYFSTDYVDPDYATLSQKDIAIAEMEEAEARNIQKRLAEQLDEADFGFDLIQTKSNETETKEGGEQIVKTDLSKLSKRQKQELMYNESPEFLTLVQDFKARLTEANNILGPFLKLMKDEKYPHCQAVTFIRTKYELVLNYCVNVAFYLMLKAKRISSASHPVIKRLAQYHQLINQLESGQGDLLSRVEEILHAKCEGFKLFNVADNCDVLRKKSKRVSNSLDGKPEDVRVESKNIRKRKSESVLNEEITIKQKILEQNDSNDGNSDVDDENMEQCMTVDTIEEKRAITYQIAKNKGLTPYRNKEKRNPRVKHRNKYRKAKIRRKGAVREIRTGINRYAGEISGIKASVKKSIKLK
ncbi:something about silencing protein 10 [Orussus abietinus]|uniref:something about silencing protein 10 n=1 Tax=Orussus abietinus TaxID=222816 RepID=UPI000625C8F3|nr:something about silencing protein 10 [Orussus abietinus]